MSASSSKGKPFSLGIKLLLNTALLGNESSVAFITIMSVPVLQSLGASLEYVSLLYGVQGALAAAMIPVLGVISDGGKNPRARKIPLVLLSNAISLVGGVILLVAVLLRLSTEYQGEYLQQVLSENLTNSLQSTTVPNVQSNSNFGHATGNSSLKLISDFKVSWLLTTGNVSEKNSAEYLGTFESAWTGVQSTTASSTSGDVTEAAILGMLAYAVLELGYDITNACVKSCAVTCSPREEQTSVLLLGLLVASVGGCSTAVLGGLDLTTLVSTITAQTSNTVLLQACIQMGVIMVLIVLGTICTVLSARFALKHYHGYTRLEGSPPVSPVRSRAKLRPDMTYTHNMADSTVLHFSAHAKNSSKESFESATVMQSSVRTFGTFDARPDRSYKTESVDSRENACTATADFNKTDVSRSVRQMDHSDSSGFCSHQIPVQNKLHEFSDRSEMATETVIKEDRENITMTTEGAVKESSFSRLSVLPELSGRDHLHKKENSHNIEHDFCDIPLCPKDKPDPESTTVLSVLTRFMQAVREKSWRNLVPVCLATYFAVGVMQGFNMFIADFLGKEVFGGAPAADPESKQAAAYNEGVRLASRGTMISFLAFGVINVFNNKLLRYIGVKREFVCVHVLFAGGLVWMTLSDSMLAFYINASLVGVQRSVTYSLPFVVATEYSQQTDTSPGKRGARVGTVIAIMSCMLPLSNCTLYSWFGPLAAYAGPSAPMYAAASCALLASGLFAAYGYL